MSFSLADIEKYRYEQSPGAAQAKVRAYLGQAAEALNPDFLGPLLMVASQKGHLEEARLLLDRGALIKSTDRWGLTSLMFASQRGHLEMVCFLLDCGASIDDPDHLGETSLMYASQNGHLEVVRFLLDRGASIDHENKAEGTALISAAYGRHLEVVRLLVDHGAGICLDKREGGVCLRAIIGIKEYSLAIVLFEGTLRHRSIISMAADINYILERAHRSDAFSTKEYKDFLRTLGEMFRVNLHGPEQRGNSAIQEPTLRSFAQPPGILSYGDGYDDVLREAPIVFEMLLCDGHLSEIGGILRFFLSSEKKSEDADRLLEQLLLLPYYFIAEFMKLLEIISSPDFDDSKFFWDRLLKVDKRSGQSLLMRLASSPQGAQYFDRTKTPNIYPILDKLNPEARHHLSEGLLHVRGALKTCEVLLMQASFRRVELVSGGNTIAWDQRQFAVRLDALGRSMVVIPRLFEESFMEFAKRLGDSVGGNERCGGMSLAEFYRMFPPEAASSSSSSIPVASATPVSELALGQALLFATRLFPSGPPTTTPSSQSSGNSGAAGGGGGVTPQN